MTQAAADPEERGEILVVAPDATESYWQPVPANGHIEVALAPHRVAMEFPFALGTQTVAPGGHVREHSHERNEEVLYILEGQGRAVIDGEEHRLVPGTAVFLGRNRRHMFINEGQSDLKWVWLIVPNGLEDFFRQIGRPRRAGDPAPANFPRPDNVLEIERSTVFAPQPKDQRQP